jgi:tetratricopeptide (TPR) repeat protein
VAIAFGWMAAQAGRSALPTSGVQADRMNNLGVGYMNQQQFEKALGAFRRARSADPNLIAPYLNQGIALLNLQQLDAAQKVLADVTRLDARSARAWYNLGLLFKAQGDAQRALAAFAHAAQLATRDPDAHYFMGSVQAQLRQFSAAIQSFQQALKLSPYHASAEFGLARAYQQSGNMAEARQHLARFQQITQSKLGAPVSVAYGEQGPLSMAESSTSEIQPVLAPIAVTFVAAEAGFSRPPAAATGDNMASIAGPGACLFDFDGDGRVDVFLASGGAQGGMALYRNRGARFEDVTTAAGLAPKAAAVGCAAGDYDNDGSADLAVGLSTGVRLFHNEKNGRFLDATEAAGIRVTGLPLGMTFIDYDHDGDLDLYVTRFPDLPLRDLAKLSSAQKTSNLVWRNNGNGTFTDVTAATGLQGEGASLAAIASDFNNDRAVDLLVTNFFSAPAMYVNPREGKFPAARAWSGDLPEQAAGATVLDFNKDGWMDVAMTHHAAPGLTLWRNREGTGFERIPLPSTNWVRAWGVTAIDYDNDGWIDLAAAGETADGRGEVRLFRNQGPQGFHDVSAEVGLDRLKVHNPRALVAGDLDGDGATDLLLTQNGGPPVLLRNQGGNRNHWVHLALRGLADAKSSFGTKIEVFAGAMHQKYELAGSSGYLGQNSPDVIAGLGQETSADVVRLLWPTGVLQDEVQVAADKPASFLEMDRRGSSCPTLFAWDGRHFQLIADMLGAGVVGHWVGPGERNVPRPVEYVKVDGSQVRLLHGKLAFRFIEPMEEVVYLDQLRLLAVDHPRGIDVYPNEYFASNPPYPAFRVITSRDARPLAGAWDDGGHNVLPQLLRRDRKYVTGFELLSFAGFAKPHTLELDLGAPYSTGPLRLLLHGYVDYFTANSMYAASQAGLQAEAPYLEALNPSGKWVRILDDMGFPAGLPRTITVDLSGKLPSGTRRIRIGTNLQIYWDQALVDRTPGEPPVRLAAVPLSSATLRFHGYPRQVPVSLAGDINFQYENSSRTGPYAREIGNYTRYGDVLPLAAQADDRLVVFGSGEEVAVQFDPSHLPELPSGWARDYFFAAVGYEKDMDFYAADANSVAPLPFRRMLSYPYAPPLSFPGDDAHIAYQLEYNTRYLSGGEAQSYRFDFAGDRPR